jgi:flagella basal body P-ring formation protein FlgA
MLCRPQAPQRNPIKPVQAGLGLLLAASSFAPNAWAQIQDGRTALFQAATEWVSQQTRLEPSQIQFNPLDERVRIPFCRQPVQFDLPFGNPNALRARCTMPNWQYLLSFQTQTQTQNPLRSATPVATNGNQPREVWVANQLIRRGTLLSPDLFEKRSMDMSPSETSLIQNPEDLKNVELLRDMQPGSPVRSHDLKPALLVKRGQLVLVSMGEGRGFLVTVRAESQQDGRLGELIRLKNPESGRLLSAMVTGPNSAKGM